MKIQITNEGDNYNIYLEGANRPVKNFRESFLSPYSFQDEDILNLIGEKAFNTSFQNGKYEYNVSKTHLQLITGERSAHNRSELELYND